MTLYNKCEWFRDGVNAIFGAVADFIKGAIDKIKDSSISIGNYQNKVASF